MQERFNSLDSGQYREFKTQETEKRGGRSIGDYVTFPVEFSVTERPLPGSDLVGAEIRLKDRTKYSGAEVLRHCGIDLVRMNEMFEKFKEHYAFLVVKGVELDNDAIKALELKRAEAIRARQSTPFITFDTKNSNGEQEMHHDGVIDVREVFTLYHPYPPYDGRSEVREAQTQIMDAAKYWSGVAEFLLNYVQQVAAGEKQWPFDEYIAQSLLQAVKNPEELDLVPTITAKYYTRLSGVSDPELKNKLVALQYMVNARFSNILERFAVEEPAQRGHELAINEHVKKDIHAISWEPGDLVFVNNTSVVHGRAFCAPVSERPVSNEVPVVRMELGALAVV